MDQEKTYKWIQDRIRDLHAGTLTAEDRVRMEELAKTDPFVQDAMEGYQANPDHDHSVLLKVIADRIQQKNTSRRPKILPLSKGWVIPAVAASLVLILATWAVMFYIEKQGHDVLVAAEPKASTSIEHSTEVYLSDADSMKEDLVDDEKKAGSREQGAGEVQANAQSELKSSSKRKESIQKNKNEKDIPNSPADDAKNSEGTIADKAAKKGEDELSKEPGVTSPAPPISQPPGRAAVEMSADKSMAAGATATKLNTKKDEGYYANQMSPDLMKQRVTGHVQGTNGETLFGALISVKNTNLITPSDYYGKFELYLPDSSSTIDVSLSGYRDTTLTVSQGDEDVNIMLRDIINSTPAGEKPASKTRQQLADSKAEKTIQPQPDYISFSTYVKENSHYPVQDIFTYTCKEVTISFTVSKNGRPELFQKIKTSEDLKYSAEAMRLFKHGPDWQCEGDEYPCMREYTIYFK